MTIAVRIGPPDAEEVVWCDPLDAERAVVRSIPLPESGHRWGDVVRHGHEPRGTRWLEGVERPVFDAIERVTASPYRTHVLVVEARGPRDLRALLEPLSRVMAAVEDWTVNLAMRCAACSIGSPHATHPSGGTWMREHDIAFASEHDVQDALLEAWESGAEGRHVIRIMTA